MQHLRSSIWPQGEGVKEIVEMVEAAFDWTAWLAPLAVHWAGHTSSKFTKLRNEDCVRVFRFMKRSRMHHSESVISEFKEPPSPNDVVVLFKQHISDQTFCGVPVVCLPEGRAALLRGSVPTVGCRHQLSDLMRSKLEITRSVIAERPWSMNAAADYLRSFVQGNRDGTNGGSPPDIAWIWNPVRPDATMPDNITEPLQAAAAPQTVRVTHRGSGRGLHGRGRGRSGEAPPQAVPPPSSLREGEPAPRAEEDSESEAASSSESDSEPSPPSSSIQRGFRRGGRGTQTVKLCSGSCGGAPDSGECARHR